MERMEKSKKNKKKKGNFLRIAKKNAKRGQFGKGTGLAQEEYNYYIRVFEQLKHVEGEDKEILVRNFFNELEREGKQVQLASNQIISRVLDLVLPLADVSQVQAFCQAFSQEIRSVCVDPFSSHVMQTLLGLSLKYCQNDAAQKRFQDDSEKNETVEEIIPLTSETKDVFKSFLWKVCKFTCNNLDDFATNTYASHVVCTVLMVCSGIDVQYVFKTKQKSQSNHGLYKEEGKILTSPPELKEILLDIAKRFIMLPNITAIITNNSSSIVAQTLLMVLRDLEEEETCNTIVEHIVTQGFSNLASWHCDVYEGEMPKDVPFLFQNNSAVHLLEVMMSCVSSEKQKELYDQYFKGNIKTLVKSPLCNFSVQKLLTGWKSKENFQELFDESIESLEVAMEVKHTGIILSLVKASRLLSSNQSRCMQAVQELLDCQQSEQFSPLLIRMMRFEEYQKMKSEGTLPKTSLHGTLILQEFLQFNKPIKIVLSLLGMSTPEMELLACDLRGCHVIKAYCDSKFVGAKNKEKLGQKLKGTFTTLACCKSGSRSLEDLWKVANIRIKTEICQELVGNEVKLKDNQFGKYIYKEFMVSLFKRNDKEDWQQLVEKNEKKRKMFDDLLKDSDDVQQPKPKKKTTKKSEEDEYFIDTAGDISD